MATGDENGAIQVWLHCEGCFQDLVARDEENEREKELDGI